MPKFRKEIYEQFWTDPKAIWSCRLRWSYSMFDKEDVPSDSEVWKEVLYPMDPLLDNYGFHDSNLIDFPCTTAPLPLELIPRCHEMYQKFAAAKQMPVLEFAKQAAQIINDSMAYEFSFIINKHLSRGELAEAEYYREARKSYIPPKEFTMRGTCGTAGHFIRKIISPKLTSPFGSDWGYSHASIHDESNASHDTTLLYSSKNWILINSLSPTDPRYILEKDDLRGKYITFTSGPVKGKILDGRLL